MPGKKFGFLALTFILVSAVLVPALFTDIASAQRSIVNSLTVVQMFGNPSDYRWQGSWDPRFDPDWQTHYRNINARDCEVRCDLFGCGWVRYYGCAACGIR